MAQKKHTLYYYIAGVLILIVGIILLARINRGPAPSPDVDADDWSKGGGSNAPVTLMEYADFQCPACASYYPLLNQLKDTFGNKLRIVYRNFPLTTIHQNAMSSAQAAGAAGKQGKFWDMHNMLFEKQSEWSEAQNAKEIFVRYAQTLGLNKDQFTADYESQEVKNKIATDVRRANALGLNSTPTFFLNGQKINNPGNFDAFRAQIEAALANTPLQDINANDLANAPDAHLHADFAVYINGKAIDFSLPKYQSKAPSTTTTSTDDEKGALDPYTHLHDGNGHIIHVHKQGVTLGYFFQTLGMDFDKNCFKRDTGEVSCTDATHSLKFFVNGARSELNDTYEIKDLDRILISYGPFTDNSLDTQIASVTNNACIYSETCPERGPAPKEECVGGLGTNCEQ